LSNIVVMTVCTDGPVPPPEELVMEGIADRVPRRYWKGITYDLYTGLRWANGVTTIEPIPAHEPVIEPTVTPTLVLRQHFTIQAPHGRTLYAAAEAARVDQRVESRRRTISDLVGLEGETDDYVVYSDVPQASARQLVAAAPAAVSSTYPSYVVDRYLGLPNDLPERVELLAHEIVAGVDSTYDRAEAIERYLRQFPYDLDVPTPPPGRDVVDYFLYDAQRGYCDYYASAFVVLARAVGIPARLAIGYTMGSYDRDLGCYVVAERNAHSWPEVYFGDRGWVAFEPTAAYETLTRPDEPVQAAFAGSEIQAPPARPWDVTLREWWRRVRPEGRRELVLSAVIVLAMGAAVVLLALLILRAVRAWRRRKLPPVQGIALCYAEMALLGERLGAARRPQDTPAEYARVLGAAVEGRMARWPWTSEDLIPLQIEAAHDAATLSEAYQRASYHPQSVTLQQRLRTDRLWKRLQRRLRHLAFASRI
jgi:transglutaminase-like putative cysteine protease